jgi:hypothetical protein
MIFISSRSKRIHLAQTLFSELRIKILNRRIHIMLLVQCLLEKITMRKKAL